jgi:hypothetical protein
MTHWKCTLRTKGRRMTLYFSQGSAHTREPETADVLDCLASDARTLESSRSFEEWALDLGYDEDSRKAERTYRAVKKQSARLRKLLGESAYKALLNADSL